MSIFDQALLTNMPSMSLSGSDPMMSVQPQPQPGPLRQALQSFQTDFVRLFHLTNNGQLRGKWDDLVAIRDWVTSPEVQLVILMNTGLSLSNILFVKPYLHDIGTTNENKKTLLQVYSVCFVSYAKICSILRVDVDEKYDKISLDNIDA